MRSFHGTDPHLWWEGLFTTAIDFGALRAVSEWRVIRPKPSRRLDTVIPTHRPSNSHGTCNAEGNRHAITILV